MEKILDVIIDMQLEDMNKVAGTIIEILSHDVYNSNISSYILAKGSFLGYEFLVESYGTHPCAYVKVDDNWDDKDNESIDCHGGITFSGTHTKVTELKEGYWIGWDYAHAEDYICYGVDHLADLKGKKWSVEEIIATDVCFVIEQLVDRRKNNNGFNGS